MASRRSYTNRHRWRAALSVLLTLVLVFNQVPTSAIGDALAIEGAGVAEAESASVTAPDAADDVPSATDVTTVDAEELPSADDASVATPAAPESEDEKPHVLVVFDCNGATVGAMEDADVVLDGTTWELPACAYAREGYLFAGWSTTADGQDVADDPATEADETFAATAMPDAQQLVGLVFRRDEQQDDGTTAEVTYDLEPAVRDGRLVLYAQWEEVPVEAMDDGDLEPAVPDEPVDTAQLVGGDTLVEVPETPDEPLLAEQSLSIRTLGLARAPQLAGAAKATEGPGADATDVPLTTAQDGTTIQSVTMQWETPDDAEDGVSSNLAIAPSDNAVATQKWQMRLSLSGGSGFEAGTVEIVVPARIWSDRGGNAVGTFALSVPEEPGGGAALAWRQEGGNVIITNMRRLSTPTQIMIEGSYSGLKASEMKDGTASDALVAAVDVVVGDETLSLSSNALTASIDTYARVASASTTAHNTQTGLDNVWYGDASAVPEALRPTNPQDYVYVRWYASGAATGSQPATLRVLDAPGSTLTYGDGQTLEVAPKILGAQGPLGIEPATAGASSVETELYTGFTTASKATYVWVAYPKAQLAEGTTYTVSNAIDYKAVPQDAAEGYVPNAEDGTLLHAEATARFRLPATYTVRKIWQDEGNTGAKPSTLYIDVRRVGVDPANRVWRRLTLNAANGWAATFSDEGSDWDFNVTEAGLPGPTNQTELIGYTYEDGTTGQVDNDLVVSKQYYNVLAGYQQSAYNYDEPSHTYTFTNTYYVNKTPRSDYTIGFSLPSASASVSKVAALGWTDSNQRSVSDKALRTLRNGTDVTVAYTVAGASRAMRETVGADVDTTDGAYVADIDNFMKTPITHELIDDGLTFGATNDGAALGIGDYYVEYVVPKAATTYDYGQTDKYSVFQYSAKNTKTPARLYGSSDGSTWVEYATVQANGTVDTTSLMNGASLDGSKVVLPAPTLTEPNAGVLYVKLAATSADAQVDLGFDVGVRLRASSQDVQRVVEQQFSGADYAIARLKNTARSQVLRAGGEDAAATSASVPAVAFLHGRNYRYAADLAKSFGNTFTNDQAGRRIVFGASLTYTQQSNVTDRTDYADALSDGTLPRTERGTFYDLLPTGVSTDVSKLALANGHIEDAYTQENYKNTGRTLLVVRVSLDDAAAYRSSVRGGASSTYNDGKYPATGYYDAHTLNMELYFDWAAWKTYGNNLRNVAAFQAEGASLGTVAGWQGEPDDPATGNNKGSLTLTDGEKTLLNDLDPVSDAPTFVYGASTKDFSGEILVSSITSSSKEVSVGGTGIWTDGGTSAEASVVEGAPYSYRLMYLCDTSGGTNEPTQIVFVDKLETYQPAGVDVSEGATWRGSLLDVDVSDLVAKGVEPAVYYATTDVAIDESHVPNLADTSTWTEWANMPASLDHKHITAVAVDASKKEDGSVFTLRAGEAAYVTLNMSAASGSGLFASGDEERLVAANKAHAYNEAFVCADHGSGKVAQRIGSTKLGILPHDLHVTATWDDAQNNDRVRPSEVKVRVLANGVPTETLTTLTADGEGVWEGTLKDVPLYDSNGRRIDYTFRAEDLSDAYEFSWARDEDEVTVTLTHVPATVDVPFSKAWDADEADKFVEEDVRPQSVTVHLYADGVDTGKALTVAPSASGAWLGTFEDVRKLTPDESNDAVAREIVYTVVEDGVDGYAAPTYETSGEGTTITNRYHPRGDLEVRKELTTNATDAAKQQKFTFTVELKDAQGQELTDLYDYQIFEADGTAATGDGASGQVGTGGEIQLADGQRFVVRDIPMQTTYVVTEAERAGFTPVSSEGATGTIRSYATQTATFVNDYAATGVAQVQVTKNVEYHAIRRYQFRFELYDVTGVASQMTTANDVREGRLPVRTVTNAAPAAVTGTSATATFGALRYVQEDIGQHVYALLETDLGVAGYTYSTDVIFAKVNVADVDGNGELSCTVTYYSDGTLAQALDSASFTNTYTASGAVSLKAWKRLRGGTLQVSQFAFRLARLGPTGQPMTVTTARNNDKGEVEFDPITFNQADIGNTYTYVAWEEEADNTALSNVDFDPKVVGFEVTVVDNNDGTLTGNVQYATYERDAATNVFTKSGDQSNPEPVFNNSMKPGSLTIKKLLSDQSDAGYNAAQRFTFRVEIDGADVDADAITFSNTSAATAWIRMPRVAQLAASIGDGLADLGDWIVDAAGAVWDELVSLVVPRKAYAETAWTNYPTTGTPNFQWKIDDQGVLYIAPPDGNSTATIAAPKNSTYTPTWVPWNSYKSDITAVKFVANTDYDEPTEQIFKCGQLQFLFGGLNSVKSLDLSYLDTSSTSDMHCMFSGCSSLESVVFPGEFGSPSGIKLQAMFLNCQSLLEVDFSKTHVKAANGTIIMKGNGPFPASGGDARRGSLCSVFYGCTSLARVDLSGLDASQATSADYLFGGCTSLSSVVLSNLKTHNITTMESMFNNCTSLAVLDLTSFDSSACISMSGMFKNCNALKSVTLGEYFRFKGNNITTAANQAILPNPSAAPADMTIAAASRQWVRVDDPSLAKTATELRDNYDDNATTWAGTWVWKAAEHNAMVVFNPRGGYIEGTATLSFVGDAEHDYAYQPQNLLDGTTVKKPGSSLLGWSTTPEGTSTGGTFYSARASYTPAADGIVTLYAQWLEEDAPSVMGDGTWQFTLEANMQITMENIAAGASYRVWEETPSGWVLVSTSGATGTIGANSTSVATFTNEYHARQTSVALAARSTLDGEPTAEASKFSYTLLAADGTTALESRGNEAGGAVNFLALVIATDDSTNVPRIAKVGDSADAELLAKYNAAGNVSHVDGTGEWTYTFKMAQGAVSDPTIEGDAQVETVQVSITVNDNGTPAATVTYVDVQGEPDDDKGVALFKNYTRPGSISIAKQISGSSDTSKEFTFDALLYDTSVGRLGTVATTWTSAGYTVEAEGTGVYVRGIKASAASAATLSGVPAGTEFQVSEVDVPSGWTQGAATGTAGKVLSTATSATSFSNSYAASGTADIVAYKRLVGAEPTAGQFSFELYDVTDVWDAAAGAYQAGKSIVDGTKTGEATNEAPDTTLSQDDPHLGMAPVTFANVSFSAAGTRYFAIREVTGGANDPVEYDAHEEHVSVSVVDNGDGTLTCTPAYDADGAVFTNAMKPGTLTITKEASGGTERASEVVAAAGGFTFDVALADAAGNPVTAGTYTVSQAGEDGADIYRITLNGDGTYARQALVEGEPSGDDEVLSAADGAAFCVQVVAGQSTSIAGLPNGCTYTITERPCAGWTSANPQAMGTVAANATSAAVFSNTYASAGTATIQVRKAYDRELWGRDFWFELRDPTGKVLQTVANDATGLVSFAPIAYTQADDGMPYAYQVVEVTDEQKSGSVVVYDNRIVDVRVVPVDVGDGTVECTITYSIDGVGTDIPTFTNIAIIDLPGTGGPGEALWPAVVATAGGVWGMRTVRRRRRGNMRPAERKDG